MSEIAKRIEERRSLYVSLAKEPLRVTLRFRTPVAATDFLMLDALLADRVINDLFPGRIAAGERIHSHELDVPLPLEERGRKFRYWAASAAVFSSSVEDTAVWHKRWHEEDDWVRFRGGKERVAHKSGRFRSYAMPLLIRPAVGAIFYAVGNPQEVRRLIEALPACGKKRSQGFGEIRAVEVEPWPEDWSCTWQGVPMRPLPTAETSRMDAEVRYMPWRPPYWYTIDGRMTACYIP